MNGALVVPVVRRIVPVGTAVAVAVVKPKNSFQPGNTGGKAIATDCSAPECTNIEGSNVGSYIWQKALCEMFERLVCGHYCFRRLALCWRGCKYICNWSLLLSSLCHEVDGFCKLLALSNPAIWACSGWYGRKSRLGRK